MDEGRAHTTRSPREVLESLFPALRPPPRFSQVSGGSHRCHVFGAAAVGAD